jgi:hypothetical protein
VPTLLALVQLSLLYGVEYATAAPRTAKTRFLPYLIQFVVTGFFRSVFGGKSRETYGFTFAVVG